MDKFFTLVVSGAVTGAIFSLVASGLTLSYSATGIFNFAYGGVAFSAAYLFYIFNTGMHWPAWSAFVMVVLVIAPLLGWLLDVAVFRHLARATDSAKIVATIGLLLALPALTEWIIDGIIDIWHVAIPRSPDVLQVGFPPGLGPVPQITWHLPGNIPINSNEVVVLGAAIVSAVGLYVLMRRTPLGLKMRAVVDRPDLARMRGVDNAQTSRVAWIIGTMLAALAGVVGAPILGAIDTNAYTVLVFVAAAAAVLGRLRSIPLAFLGGLILGIAENLVTGYASFASDINGFNESVPVVMLLVALVFLAQRRGRRAGQASDEVPPPDYLQHLPPWRRALPWVLATGFLIAYITVLSNTFWSGVMAQGLALSLVFLSFVVVTGMGGMVSLAQAAFVTTAGLTTGLLFDHFGWPFYGAAAAAVAVTVAVGVVVALPALRLGGLFLALATLALAILGDNVLFQWAWLSNTTSGWTIPRLVIGPLDLTDNRTMAMVLLGMVLLVMLLIRNLRVSSWGRSIAAVRSSEVAAATSGVSAVRVKLGLFAVSAAIAGVGGIMYASFQTTVSNASTPYVNGLLWLATVVLFGIRRPAAAAFAGIASVITPVIIQSGFHWWSWVPSWLSWNGTAVSEIPLILFGLGAVTLARNPDGFLSQGARQRYELSRRLQARRIERAAARRAPAGPCGCGRCGGRSLPPDRGGPLAGGQGNRAGGGGHRRGDAAPRGSARFLRCPPWFGRPLPAVGGHVDGSRPPRRVWGRGGAPRRRPGRTGGPDHRPVRCQRWRQVDAVLHGGRAGGAVQGNRDLGRAGRHEVCAPPPGGPRHARGAGVPRHIPGPHRRGEPDAALARRPPRGGLRAILGPRAAPSSGGGHPVGWGAADAGPRAGPRGSATTGRGRRADPGPGPTRGGPAHGSLPGAQDGGQRHFGDRGEGA